MKENPQERLLVFTLASSSFMRDFEGRWQVGGWVCWVGVCTFVSSAGV